MFMNSLRFVLGGPFVIKESQDRYVLVGTLHGSYVDCSNQWPTLYTRIDDYSILQFLRKIIFNETIPDSGKFELYLSNYYRRSLVLLVGHLSLKGS